jgi:hypothetical protein
MFNVDEFETKKIQAQKEWDLFPEEERQDNIRQAEWLISIPTLNHLKPIYVPEIPLTIFIVLQTGWNIIEGWSENETEREEIILRRADVVIDQFRFDLLTTINYHDVKDIGANKNLLLTFLKNNGIKTTTGKPITQATLDKELITLCKEGYIFDEEIEYNTEGGKQRLKAYHIFPMGITVIGCRLNTFSNRRNKALIDKLIGAINAKDDKKDSRPINKPTAIPFRQIT